MPLQNNPRHTKKILLYIISVAFVFISCSATGHTNGDKPEYIHPEFLITSVDLEKLIQDIPVTQQKSIKERPQVFLDLISQVLELRIEYTVLVDKEHALSEDFRPDDLVSLNEYPQLRTARNDLSLAASIMPQVLALTEAASQDGIQLTYGSTFRSYRYQVGLFNHWVDQLGLETAERVSARPGHSQHQIGTVIDFSPISQVFSGTRDFEWLKDNAHIFGFSLSYPENLEDLTGYQYESWHWRYIHPSGIQLQREFFDDIQQYYLSFLHANKPYFAEARVTDATD